MGQPIFFKIRATVPAADGTTRRLRAIAAAGHPLEDIADWLGVSTRHVWQLQRQEITDPALNGPIRALFDRVAIRPGRCDVTRWTAEVAGWPTAWAWDSNDELDTVAIDIRPDVHAVTGAIGDRLILRMVSEGRTELEIASRMNMSVSTIQRRKAALRNDGQLAAAG
jgi:hypothetical protein